MMFMLITVASFFATMALAYWMYGWENVIDELVCGAAVAASTVFGMSTGHDNGFHVIMWGTCTQLVTLFICAFCKPWSIIEMVLIGLLCVSNAFWAPTVMPKSARRHA